MTMSTQAQALLPLADGHVTLYESPDPQRLFAYSPGIIRLADGRLVATIDLGGPGASELPDPKFRRTEPRGVWQGRVLTSDDAGSTWIQRNLYPFMHARPFAAGNSLYVLGQATDLMIIRSDDAGATWSAPVALTDGQYWHQAPCNVHHANGCVYLVMERRSRFHVKGWYVGDIAPVLMRGRVGDDLTRGKNWTFASELPFYEAMTGTEPDFFGVPFYAADPVHGVLVAPGRHCSPMGWLETNVVQFGDPDHIWHDPTGRTFHLWMRAHTGGSGYAAIAKVVEQGGQAGTGAMTTMLEKVPSGKTMLFVPCPGGQMKFHVLYDDATRLYWLLSTQATDSMIRPDRMPADRFNLPNNERRRLQLHFSKNMVDWCFAGLVTAGPVQKASRHYASMVFDGDDLVVLSRSGDERAKSPHDGNLITLHRVKDFRGLVY
jgi:hypothetical protein